MAGFVFATCALGLERFLKEEVSRARPALRLAFSRPGLVTWKSDAEIAPDIELGAAFARVWGMTAGRASDAGQAAALAAAMLSGIRTTATARLHVFARDPAADGADGAVAETKAALTTALGDRVAASPAAPGDVVLDIIVAPGEPIVVGAHRHRRGRGCEPGGVVAAEVPPDAPSRAYGKILEAIAWAELELRPGDVAVEIGSAPGGAALALVRRGVTVWGIDTGAMDPAVLAERGPAGACVHHLPIKVGALRWEELPPRVDWLLVDVNLAPQVAIHSVRRLMPRLRPSLRGAVLTLKMNELAFVRELPAILDRIRDLGFADVAATHLPSNRQELCAVAHTPS